MAEADLHNVFGGERHREVQVTTDGGCLDNILSRNFKNLAN
jgi:hypothetical protein